MSHRGAKREAQRVQGNREELLERMARALPEGGAREALDGLFYLMGMSATRKRD